MAWPGTATEFALRVIIPVGLFHAAALMAWPATQARSRIVQLAICVLAAALSVWAEVLVWPEAKIVRGCVAVVALLLALRVLSYCRSTIRGGFLNYVRFLSLALLSPHLVYSPSGYATRRRTPVGVEILRLAGGVTTAVVLFYVTKQLIGTQAAINSWFVNDLIITVGFVFMVQAVGQGFLGLWQLLGIRSHPLMDNILLSRTPADFWRRWSWPIHIWLYRYVYVPAGGNPNRVKATLATFLISGLQHELLVVLAIGRATGHQTAFFMLNAIGVIASPTMERFARRGILAQSLVRLTTILFLAATASLMFITFNYIFPIYHKRIWLMW
jgi:MBOAT, membrane-bound O-acyltransferase family